MAAPRGQFDDESASAGTSVSLELLEELPLGPSRGKGKKLVGSRLARPGSLVKWQHSERVPTWDAVLPGPWTLELPTMTEIGALEQSMVAMGWETQSKRGHSAATRKDKGTEVSPRCSGLAPNIRSSILG